MDNLAEQLFTESKNKVAFQKEVSTGLLLARADITTYDAATDTYNLYETKSSTQIKKEHYFYISFQRVVFEKAGLTVSKTFDQPGNCRTAKNPRRRRGAEEESFWYGLC